MAFPISPSDGQIYNNYRYNSSENIWRKFKTHNLYPVGSIYTNAFDGTNPSTLLGFGTWEKIGEGKVLVGDGFIDDGENTKTYTAGETGGSLRHKHISPISNGGGTGSSGMRMASGGDDGSIAWPYGYTTDITASTKEDEVNDIDNDSSWFYTSDESTEQPYVVVYLWKRTA